jgi:hypothetical protein
MVPMLSTEFLFMTSKVHLQAKVLGMQNLDKLPKKQLVK